MKTSLEFFMTKEDEKEFMETFKDMDFDFIKEESEEILYYICGEESLQLLLCEHYDKILTKGRIAIKTHYKNDNTKRCESLYRKMKRFIQKHYTNDLVVYNFKLVDRSSAVPLSRSLYVSPRIVQSLNKDEVILKQSKNGYIVFDIYREEIDGNNKCL